MLEVVHQANHGANLAPTIGGLTLHELLAQSKMHDYDAQPTREDYRRIDVQSSFDWRKVITETTTAKNMPADQPLYLVVFRSILRPDADRMLLAKHDIRAYAVAESSTALLHYHGPEPDEDGYGTSWCLWTDRESAQIATAHPGHRGAAALAAASYQTYELERYNVQLVDEQVIFQPVTEDK